MYRSATLLGRDHANLGELSVIPITPRLAIGISMGRFPKGYPSTEPNEDAVFAATDGATTVLAVADGHHGATTSHRVIEVIASACEKAITARDPLEFLGEVAVDTSAAVSDSSDSALTICVVDGKGARAVTFGDTSLLHTRGGMTQMLLDGESGFLRENGLPERWELDELDQGTLSVVSDGITSFMPRDRPDVSADPDAARAENQVRNLVEEAFEGGAGDNIAVAVTLL